VDAEDYGERGRQTGSKDFNYTQSGKKVVVTLNINKNNVTSVSSKVENPKPVKKKP
jgi:hypothetical protein